MKRTILSLGKELSKKNQQLIKGGYMDKEDGDCTQACSAQPGGKCPSGQRCASAGCKRFGEWGTICVNNA